MKRALLAAGLLSVFAPLAAQAQADAEARCRAELASRGIGGTVERVQVNGGSVTGNLRSGNEVLAFNCLVDNSGNVMEVRVDRTRAAVEREDNAAEFQRGYRNDNGAEFQRGYRDGSRKSPYNNYANSGDYERGYDAGWEARRRNR